VRFEHPWWLLLGLTGPAILLWVRARRVRAASVGYPDLAHLRSLRRRAKARWLVVPPVLQVAALVLIGGAMARPQAQWQDIEGETLGLDIMLVLDVSGSMKSQDFKPHDRFHVARDVMAEFIGSRPADRLGLVVFARQAFTQCPLTVDRAALVRLLQNTHIGMIQDGTALGSAIATAANRLTKSDAKSKVMILLTDGRNNAGPVDPVTAARAAGALGVRIYTIGAGRPGVHPFPIDDPVWGRRYVNMPLDLDEETLKAVADTTGGAYYRARTENALAEIYDQIGELEKSRLPVKAITRHEQLFHRLALPALVLLFVGWSMEHVVLGKLP
jgi:Ca-activated chloride channel family protein